MSLFSFSDSLWNEGLIISSDKKKKINQIIFGVIKINKKIKHTKANVVDTATATADASIMLTPFFLIRCLFSFGISLMDDVRQEEDIQQKHYMNTVIRPRDKDESLSEHEQ